MNRTILTLTLLIGCNEPTDDDSVSVVSMSASETVTISAGSEANVPVWFGEVWQAMQCVEGVCADIGDRVAVVDGRLCGPMPYPVAEMLTSSHDWSDCNLGHASGDIQVTIMLPEASGPE